MYNLEATPAEGTTYRFAKEDRKRFPDILQAGTLPAIDSAFTANRTRFQTDLGATTLATYTDLDALFAAWVMMGHTDVIITFFSNCAPCPGNYNASHFNLTQNATVAQAMAGCNISTNCGGTSGGEGEGAGGEPHEDAGGGDEAEFDGIAGDASAGDGAGANADGEGGDEEDSEHRGDLGR